MVWIIALLVTILPRLKKKDTAIDAASQRDEEVVEAYTVQKGFESVHKAFDKFIVSYSNGNLETVTSLISPDENVVFIGSGKNKILIGKGAIKNSL